MFMLVGSQMVKGAPSPLRAGVNWRVRIPPGQLEWWKCHGKVGGADIKDKPEQSKSKTVVDGLCSLLGR